MGAEQSKRAGFIDVHQAGIAFHISTEYGGETSMDDGGGLVHRRAGPLDGSYPNTYAA
jgi:hypothetical protein